MNKKYLILFSVISCLSFSSLSHASLVILNDSRYLNDQAHTGLGGDFSANASYYEIGGSMGSSVSASGLSGDMYVTTSGGGYGDAITVRYQVEFLVTDETPFRLTTNYTTTGADSYINLSSTYTDSFGNTTPPTEVYELLPGDVYDAVNPDVPTDPYSHTFSHSGTLEEASPIGDVITFGTIYTLDAYISIDDFWGNGAYEHIEFELQPVPVPAAAWLFVTAIMGLVGIRRR